MSAQDTRWLQGLSNDRRALAQLKKFIDQGELNELEQQGMIKAFEFTHELAWNVMKDYFNYQGNHNIHGSRNAFQPGLLSDGEAWMGMIHSRNQPAHTYNKATADKIAALIPGSYFTLFCEFERRMVELSDGA